MSFASFHADAVPTLLARGNGAMAARALRPGDSLALALADGPAYTYRCTGDDLAVVAGTAGADAVVELDEAAFADLVTEAWSVFGLLYGDRVRVQRGDFFAFAAWEAPLQAFWFGRPIYDAAAVDAVRSLDLRRSFSLADDDAAMAGFLATAGYLVLRGVLGSDEVGRLNALVAAERPAPHRATGGPGGRRVPTVPRCAAGSPTWRSGHRLSPRSRRTSGSSGLPPSPTRRSCRVRTASTAFLS